MKGNLRQKKVVLINTVLYGSTGKIVRQLQSLAEENGMQVFTASAFARNSNVEYGERDIVIGKFFDRYLHLWLSRVTGLSGVFSINATLKLIRRLEKIQPDVVHIHNLHNAYINLPILFKYIKKNNIKTIWTLHDCWAFTGRCPHFERVDCDKWKTGCSQCPYPKEDYPITYIDRTKKMWAIKNKQFNGVQDMTIVTPSEWLAGLVRESFLKQYPIKVINNGIDLDTFRPTKGHIYDELRSKGKKIVLGVAMGWNIKKGLDVFKQLSKDLKDEYQLVMVGTDEELANELSGYGITCIERTNSQQDLAEIYTAADVFVNPTREDTFPTVNIEALACGTPVITFDTGGSPEMLDRECGIIVEKNDIKALEEAIISFCDKRSQVSDACVSKASHYGKKKRLGDYLNIYGA